MNDTQKILRNWKIVWTILAIVLSLFVIIAGVKYNPAWSTLQFDCSKNRIDSITDCNISVDSASSITFELIMGLVFFFMYQSIHIPIWTTRNYLVNDRQKSKQGGINKK